MNHVTYFKIFLLSFLISVVKSSFRDLNLCSLQEPRENNKRPKWFYESQHIQP